MGKDLMSFTGIMFTKIPVNKQLDVRINLNRLFIYEILTCLVPESVSSSILKHHSCYILDK